jgi:hypothetical protein
MKRIEREILAALDAAGPKSHAAKIYEVIARGRINPMPFAEFYTLLNRLAVEPDGMVSEMIMRNRRVFWLTRNGRRALDKGKRHEAI